MWRLVLVINLPANPPLSPLLSINALPNTLGSCRHYVEMMIPFLVNMGYISFKQG